MPRCAWLTAISFHANYEKALSAYGYIIDKKAPNSDYAYYQRGTIYGLMGNDNAKIKELKRITEKYPQLHLRG